MGEQLVVGKIGDCVQSGRCHLDLAVGIPLDESHLGSVLGRQVKSRGSRLQVSCDGREIVTPCSATVGDIDPCEERRDHRSQLGEHQIGVVANLRKRMCPHPHQEHLVGLAASEDPHIRRGRRRQHAPQIVTGLGPDG